jgi:hypothetical protein
MACTCEPSYGFLCKECRLADDTYELLEQRDDAYGHLSRLFRYYAPHCEPLPTLPGLATQLDNLLVQIANQRQELIVALRAVIREWEHEDVSVIAINAARAAVARAEGGMREEGATIDLQQDAGLLLEKNTRWLTSPPSVKINEDTVAAAALLRDSNRLIRGLLARREHTCHDMNPPFPGPCLACADERGHMKRRAND